MKNRTFRFLLVSSLVPLILSFFVSSIQDIIEGLYAILVSSDVLITDYIVIGGLGATLFNVGIVSLFSVGLLYISKAEINGTAIASVYLMGSFAFFGKNIFNVLPILLGTFLYSKVSKTPFKEIVNSALLGTSFAPIVMEIFNFVPGPDFARLLAAIAVGLSAGFLIVPVAKHLFHVHEGFNLYNTGFAVGILATLYVSIMRSYGYESSVQMVLDQGHTAIYAPVLLFIFLFFWLSGFIMNNKSMKSYRHLLKETGYENNDFYIHYGLPTVLINMGINGIMALVYVLFIAKAELNGPIIGAILTVVGFSALGKHIFNILPIFLGVVLGSLTKSWTLDQPAILFAALFGTALAPIAGYYGFFWGVLASFINSSVVLNSGQLHLGMNLYNTGFSVGIVSAVMVPVMHKFSRKHANEPFIDHVEGDA